MLELSKALVELPTPALLKPSTALPPLSHHPSKTRPPPFHRLPPTTLEAVYFEQLSSERLITKFSRGRPVKMFERIPGRRAETLDCLVMAYAARQGLALNLDAREADLRLEPQPTPRPVVTPQPVDGRGILGGLGSSFLP
jgi:phage terminase large subunit GpA-like protein